MGKFLFSSALLGWLSLSLVNAQAVDSLSERGKYEFLSLRVGVSINHAIQTLSRVNDTKYSFQADAVFGRYMLVAEYGQAEISRTNLDQQDATDNLYRYASDGWFFRVGPDVNLLINQAKTGFWADSDIIFFGLRFGHAQIRDVLIYETTDENQDDGNKNGFWESEQLTAENGRLGVNWIEMTAGMKVQLFRNVFLGYNLRYKFGRSFAGNYSLVPYEVPGFGKGENKNSFGFDYYLFYRIPFRK